MYLGNGKVETFEGDIYGKSFGVYGIEQQIYLPNDLERSTIYNKLILY